MLYSPALLDELEAAERLQQGLQDVTALEMANAPADQSTGRTRSVVVTLFQSPRYAMAASVLLLISLSCSSFLLQQRPAFELRSMAACLCKPRSFRWSRSGQLPAVIRSIH